MEDTKNIKVVKDIIDRYYDSASCGIFRNKNQFGDPMETVYEENGVKIDVCFYYSYMEVFGLSDEEYKVIDKYYKNKAKEYIE